jgi:hypothetical protein
MCWRLVYDANQSILRYVISNDLQASPNAPVTEYNNLGWLEVHFQAHHFTKLLY